MTSELQNARNKTKAITSTEKNGTLPNANLRTENIDGKLECESLKTDIYHSFYPIYHVSKICGLLPVEFSPMGRGLFSGKLRSIEVLYGYLLVLFLISAQSWGLWRDLRHGWKNSTRLSSQTAVIVTCSDGVSVAGVVIIAILTFPLRWKHIQKTLSKLAEVDEELGISTTDKLQRNTIILIISPLLFLIVTSSLDYFTWLRSNKRKNLLPREDRGPINYSPIYLMYFLITIFVTQFALGALHIGKRFARLNGDLEILLRSYRIKAHLKKNSRRENQSIASGVSLLITSHQHLCESALSLSSGFGLPLLFATLSCLVHLIITPYFMYTEMENENCSWEVLFLQSLWIIFHIMKLLFTVQPCYWSTLQAKKTGIRICQLLACEWETEIRKQLEIFSLQVLHRPLDFTACGLFSINRSLATSIAAAVTTYLVILIQFQDRDDDDDDDNEIIQGAKKLLESST